MVSREISETEALENLANATILQAVQDYKIAYKNHLENPFDKEVRDKVEDLRRFFRSGWYAALTTADGDYILEAIEKEVKEGHARQVKHMYSRKETDLWK